ARVPWRADHWVCWLLRAGRERPCGSRPAEQGNELTSAWCLTWGLPPLSGGVGCYRPLLCCHPNDSTHDGAALRDFSPVGLPDCYLILDRAIALQIAVIPRVDRGPGHDCSSRSAISRS